MRADQPGKIPVELQAVLDAVQKNLGGGKTEGTFTCPECGGKVAWRVYHHPQPGNAGGKGIVARCERGCFRLMS